MEFIVNHREPVSRENVELSPLDVVIAYGKHNDMANTLLKKGFKPKNLQVYYRDIKSFIFAYKHRFFPPGFSIFEPALKYGKGDIIRFLISKGHKIIVHKNMVRTIGRGVRTLWKMGHKLQPIIDDKTGFVGDSEWLEEQWQKIAEGACGGNHRDMVTLESIGEQFIKIVLPGGHIRCYPKNSTLKFMKANVFANWVQSVPERPIDDMGYSGRPGKQRFVRTLDNTWLTYDSARRIVKATPSHFTFNAVKVARNQRIGNLRGTFGVSENHGQLPGFTVYELQPASVSGRVMSMRKARSSERTRLMIPKNRRVPPKIARGGAGRSDRSPINPLFRRRERPPVSVPPVIPPPPTLTIEKVNQLVRGGESWNNILASAAESGHMDIVKYAESKGANDWNNALIEAALGGHLDIVKYAESKGATNWEDIATNAARGGHLDIVKYAESKGGDYWDEAFYEARDGDHRDVVNYIRTHHPDEL